MGWQGTIESIRRCRTRRGRASSGLFAIEGLRLHERAVRSGNAPHAVVVSEAFMADPDSRARALITALHEDGCQVDVAPDEVLNQLVEGRGLGDIVGLVRMPMPVPVSDAVGAAVAHGGPVVVAVEIFDPGNCGALVRTSLAGGAKLFVAAGRTDPYHPKAVQTSMGSLFKIPIVRADDVDACVASIRECGVKLIGMTCTAETTLPLHGSVREPVAIVLGSESFGLPDAVSSRLDLEVRIPMPDGVDSFSVNAAAAIVLYEFGQRGGGPTSPRSG